MSWTDLLTDPFQIFLLAAAVGAVLLLGIPFLHYRKATSKGPGYRRGPVYRVWVRQQEFRILGIRTLDDVDKLITYLTDTYDLELIEHDPEPDESFWVFTSALGDITLFYDDHEGVRIRTVKKTKTGLFQRLVRDVPVTRRFLSL